MITQRSTKVCRVQKPGFVSDFTETPTSRRFMKVCNYTDMVRLCRELQVKSGACSGELLLLHMFSQRFGSEGRKLQVWVPRDRETHPV